MSHYFLNINFSIIQTAATGLEETPQMRIRRHAGKDGIYLGYGITLPFPGTVFLPECGSIPLSPNEELLIEGEDAEDFFLLTAFTMKVKRKLYEYFFTEVQKLKNTPWEYVKTSDVPVYWTVEKCSQTKAFLKKEDAVRYFLNTHYTSTLSRILGTRSAEQIATFPHKEALYLSLHDSITKAEQDLIYQFASDQNIQIEDPPKEIPTSLIANTHYAMNEFIDKLFFFLGADHDDHGKYTAFFFPISIYPWLRFVRAESMPECFQGRMNPDGTMSVPLPSSLNHLSVREIMENMKDFLCFNPEWVLTDIRNLENC